ncbi:MAG: RNase H-like domain-containing protein, partial [Nitrososphaerales archaeon]
TLNYKDLDNTSSNNLLTLVSVFNQKARSKLVYIDCKLNIEGKENKNPSEFSFLRLLVAVSDMINDDLILSLNDYVDLVDQHEIIFPTVEVQINPNSKTDILVVQNVELINDIDLVDCDDIVDSHDVCGTNVNIADTNVVMHNIVNNVQCDQISKCHSVKDLNKKLSEAVVLKTQKQNPNEHLSQTDLLTSTQIKSMQREDKNLEIYFKTVGQPDSKFYVCPETGLLFRNTTLGGRLINQLVVPHTVWETIFEKAHTVHHWGMNKCFDRISAQFFIPRLGKFIASKINSCEVCQLNRNKTVHDRIPIEKIPRPVRSGLAIAIDVLGPFEIKSSKRHQYILSVIEVNSKYPILFPLKTNSAIEIVDCLMEVFAMLGISDIFSDRGVSFVASLNQEIYKRLGVQIRHGGVGHSSSYGLIERLNGTVVKLMKAIFQTEKPREWHLYLTHLMFVLRSSKNTSSGFSPHELLFGHAPRDVLQILKENWIERGKDEFPKLKKDYTKYLVDLQQRLKLVSDIATENIDKAQEKYVSSYNEWTQEKIFEIGDDVLVLQPSHTTKMLSRWIPAKIVDKVSKNTYAVKMLNEGIKTLHSDHLRPFIASVQALGIIYEEDNSDEEIIYPPLSDDWLKERGKDKQDKFDKLDLSHLTSEQQIKLRRMLRKHERLFSDIPGKTKVVYHTIPLVEGATPKAYKAYRIPEKFKAEVERQIDDLLKQGRIVRSESAFAAPVVTVLKQDQKSVRLCCNYKGLNDITVDQPYTFPRIDEMTRKASQFKFLTKLDATASFWQVPVLPEHTHRTAFICHRGVFEWLYLPFGLKGASNSFQRLVDIVLHPYRAFAEGYIDDISVGSNTFDSHLVNLDQVLTAFEKQGLTFKLENCEFVKPKVQLLGFIVGSGEISLVKSKVEAIERIPEPGTKKQVRSFLGMANYFRNFIPNFSTIAHPLTELTKAKFPAKFTLKEGEVKAFKELKAALMSSAVLCTPQYDKDFIVFADSSDVGIGCVLGQKGLDDKFRPISYASKKFSDKERLLPIIEREAMSVLFALKYFELIIFGSHVTLYSDHSPLAYISSGVSMSAKLTRWSLAIQRFNVTIKHIKGSSNT